MTAGLFKQLVNSSVDGILAFDRNCRYTAWNPALERLFGVSQRDAMGQYAFDLLPFLKETGEDKFYFEALAGRSVIASDRPYIIPGTGQPGFYEGHYSPVLDEPGEIVGGMALIHDVTRRSRRNELAKTLTRIGLALNAVLDLPELLDLICQESMSLFEVAAAGVWLVQDDEVVGFAGYGQDRDKFIGQRVPLSDPQTLGTRVIREKRPILVNEADRSSEVNRELVDDFAVKAILGVPLMNGEQAVGALMIIDTRQPDRFSQEDAETALVLGSHAAIAIQNARLYEQAQQEIRERRQAEEVLKEERNLLRTLIDHLPDYVYVKDTASRFVNSNVATARVMGVASPEELIGKTDFDFYPQVLAAQYYADEQQIFESGQPLIDQEEPALDPAGSERWVSTAKVPWRDSQGEIAGLVGIGRDITERKQVEAELNAHRERLETRVQERTAELERAVVEIAAAHDRIDAILRSVADGLIVTDPHQKVILANPAAADLLHLRPEEMVGQDIRASLKDDRLQELVRHTLEQQSSGHEIDIELEKIAKKRRRVLRARTAPVDDRQGQPLGTVTLIQDVTRLREVDRLKTELLTTAAHELRTPLTSIMGFSEILLTRQLEPARRQSYLTMINEQANHLAKIIKDLLDVSRLQTGRNMDLNLQPVDMASLLQDVIMPFTETTTEHEIEVEGLSELPSINGDPFRLAQVGRNLLSNAIKFSPQGGAITLRGRIIPDFLEISFQDEGIGMTPEQQDHLFEPFYRADASFTAVGGAGLGLAISRQIIEQHEGEIWVESKRGRGTTVYFTLPLADSFASDRAERILSHETVT